MFDDPRKTQDDSPSSPVYETSASELSTWEAEPRLTVLRALNGKKCVKIHSLDGVTAYDKSFKFSFQEVSIKNFDALAALLNDLEVKDDRLIVFGRVTEAYRNRSQIPRRKKPRDKELASIEDAGSQIAMFDCDDIDVPEGFGWHEPAALAEATWAILVERVPALENVNAFWQASASAGQPKVADKAKFHFWVLLDSPLSEKQRRILYAKAETDAQLSCPIQPHYIGRPRFEGVDDPLTSLPRSGVIEGAFQRVCVGHLDLGAQKVSKRAWRPKVEVSPAPQNGSTAPTWAERLLDEACDLIRSADAENIEINKQSFFVGGAVAKGLISEDTAHVRLKEAAEATGHNRFEEALKNGFRDGLKAPLEWDAKPEKPKNIAPYHTGASEDRASAVNKSRSMIRAWATEAIECAKNQNSCAPPRAMQHGMQGGGKTSALVGRVSRGENGSQSGTSLGALHKASGLVSAMYMPTHVKCEEAAQVYEDCAPKGAPPCIVIRGRSRPDPHGAPDQKMCLFSELADYLAKQGATVRSTLCTTCPLKNQCGYIKQEKLVEKHVQSGTGLVVFAPHAYAFLPLPAETLSDIAIFDESPGSTILDRVSISVPDLLFDLQFGGTTRHISRKQENGTAADALKFAKDTISPTLKTIAAAFCPERGLDLTQLHEAGVDTVRMDEILEALDQYRDKRVPRILGQSLANGNEKATVASAAQKARKLAKTFKAESDLRIDHLKVFLGILKSELETGRRWPTAITNHGPSTRELTAVRLRPLTHAANKPFLYIDGTGDPDLAKIMFGTDLAPHLFAAERNAHVTQVIGNRFSTKYVLGENSAKELLDIPTTDKSIELRRRLNVVLDRFPDAAVFASKKIEEALGLADDPRAGHFNAVRGLNQWQDRETAIIIGREQPPLTEIELTARAFAAKIGHPIVCSDPVWEWRGIRTRGKDGSHPIIVMTHPDNLVEKLLHQMREAEIAQAIDRLRLVHNQHPKEVIILNEIATNITVDRVVDWRVFWRGGTRPERAIQTHGFLPLNGQEAVSIFPEIWSNRETANQDFKFYRSLVSDSAYEDIIYTKPDAKVVCHVRYKRNVSLGQRAHWRAGLVYCPADQAQERIERFTGALRDFEVTQETGRTFSPHSNNDGRSCGNR